MLETGARLINGRYALTPNPRRGGMAEVFAASDLSADAKKVAVKLFKEEYTHSELLSVLVKHSRHYWQMLAESHLTRRLFGSMVRRIDALAVAPGKPPQGDKPSEARRRRIGV